MTEEIKSKDITKNKDVVEFICIYCGSITTCDEEDNTWQCVNPKCWASKKVYGDIINE